MPIKARLAGNGPPQAWKVAAAAGSRPRLAAGLAPGNQAVGCRAARGPERAPPLLIVSAKPAIFGVA